MDYAPIPDSTPITPGEPYRTWFVMRGPYQPEIVQNIAGRVLGLANSIPGFHASKVAWYGPGTPTVALGLPIPEDAYVGRWKPWVIKVEWTKGQGTVTTRGPARLGVPNETEVIPAIAIVAAAIAAIVLAVAGLLIVTHFTEKATRNTVFNPGFLIVAVIIVALLMGKGKA